MEKFPDHIDTAVAPISNGVIVSSPIKQATVFANGASAHPTQSQDRWRPAVAARENGGSQSPIPVRASGTYSPARYSPSPSRATGRNRQKSIGDAFRTLRARRGSISQNAHELAHALRAPMSPMLICLCILWYVSSALTNTSSKSILNAFDKPATLTVVQFAMVSLYCVLAASVAAMIPILRAKVPVLRHPIRSPSRQVLTTTMPLAVFQIAGHLLSSNATAMIPVSLVHTIKGLSPLFTVLAYRMLYDIHYPMATYLSLVPLTGGVMLACSGNTSFGGHFLGVLYALLAAMVFVTQNIFSKKLFNEAAQAERQTGGDSSKLDKLNLLCYSSGLAFLMTLPIWAWAEGFDLIADVMHDGTVHLKAGPNALDHGRLVAEFFFNGTFHWAQNILAFILLSMVSPVTYSVASLLKRVFVIIIAIIWFRSPTTVLQGVGIGLTFVGLYLYDRSSESNKADRKARSQLSQNGGSTLLPVTSMTQIPPPARDAGSSVTSGALAIPAAVDDKKSDDARPAASSTSSSLASSNHNLGWLPPGTTQEDTWRLADRQPGV